MLAFRRRTECRLIQGRDHVQHVEPILTRDGFDSAVVARTAEVQLLEYREGLRVTLLHVTDDRVTADQLIESKHRIGSFGVRVACIRSAKYGGFVISEVAGEVKVDWVISPGLGGGRHRCEN